MADRSADRLLCEFILDAFHPEELRGLAAELGGSSLVAALPASISFQELAEEFVEALRRRGLLDAPLFDALMDARPRRAHEILALRRAFALGTSGPHIFIVHASHDEALASSLAKGLRRAGIDIWLDTADIMPGVRWDAALGQALRRASAVVVMVTPELANSRWASLEIEHARSTGIPVLPVLVGDVPLELLPDTLRLYQALRISDATTIEPVIQALQKITAAAIPSGGSNTSSPVFELSLRFLEAVGRTVRILEPSRLQIPETTVLATTTPPTSLDVVALEGMATESGVSYFLYDGPLSEPVAHHLDGMRIRGNPVVTIAADTMRAALQDRNAPAVFAEHTRLGTDGVNLFEATNAIANPNLFFGRTELLNQVGSALKRGDAVLVTGARKAGKSSFLHMLRQEFSAQPVAWIDLQRLSRDDRDWPDRAFTLILHAWDRWGRNTWDGAWPFTHGTKKTEKATFIDEMEARRQHQATLGRASDILVVLDEIERMIPGEGNPHEGDRFEQFTGALRSLAQGAERCITTLAADLRPEANRRNLLPNRHTNPWFSFFVEVALPPLTQDEVDQMVRRLAARMGVTDVEDQFVAQLHGFTGGHAYMTRLVAAAAWSGRQSRERLMLSDLGAGRRQLEKQATLRRFYEENLWIPLTDDERRALLGRIRRSWWRNLFSRTPTDSDASAALRAQGLLDDRGITIAGFDAWLQDRPPSGLDLASHRATG